MSRTGATTTHAAICPITWKILNAAICFPPKLPDSIFTDFLAKPATKPNTAEAMIQLHHGDPQDQSINV